MAEKLQVAAENVSSNGSATWNRACPVQQNDGNCI